MGLTVIKKMSDSSVFLTGLTAITLVALVLGYLVYSKSGKKDEREISIAFRAAGIRTNNDVLTYDINPTQLKARIMQILINNTMDLEILNNATDHVLNKIEADMQDQGILHGLLVERAIGRITRNQFNYKLAEYIKNVAASLSIPLMNRDHGYGSFVRRYIEGGGGSGGTWVGTKYRRISQAFPSRISAYNPRNSRSSLSQNYGPDNQIELIDNELRRLP